MIRGKHHPDRAYLLRRWREEDTAFEGSQWRFSVEEVLHERHRRGFSTLEALIAFLQAELTADESGAPDGI